MQTGTFPAIVNSAQLWESKEGACMIEFAFQFENSETLRDSMCLMQKDGTISQITVNTCKTIFGWDGVDPFWMETIENVQGKPCEVVVEEEEYNGKNIFRAKYINPPGGGSVKPHVDRNKFLAKYGAKFRALNGGAPVKPIAKPNGNGNGKAPVKPATPQADPPTLPGFPVPPAKPPPPPVTKPKVVGTMEGAWQALCEANPGMEEEKLHYAWHEAIRKTGKAQQDLTDEDWGQITMEVSDNVAF